MNAKSLQFQTFGKPEEVLNIIHKEIPAPQADEVVVRMIASPINPSDLLPVKGAYSHRIPLPNIPGYEGVGIVEAAGSAVNPDLIGRRVLPLRGEGTWQQYAAAKAHFAVPVPDGVDDFTAAQMYINPVTAWVICTDELQLQPGDALLVNAGGSSIGRIFAQLSSVLGYRFIAVTRSNRQTDELLALGASAVVDTSKEPLRERVMELTGGQGADAAIDSIGGADGNELAFFVREGGIFLALGLLSGVQVDWGKIARETKAVPKLFHLRHWNSRVSNGEWQKTMRRLLLLAERKQLQFVPPSACYPISAVKQAMQAAETTSASEGKVMLIFE